MRIAEKTITVVLESEDGDAKFVFERMRGNEHERFMAELSRYSHEGAQPTGFELHQVTKAFEDGILATLRSVEGLEHADGSLVTVEQVKNKEIYRDILSQILIAYQAVIAPKGEEEKKDTKPESSSA